MSQLNKNDHLKNIATLMCHDFCYGIMKDIEHSFESKLGELCDTLETLEITFDTSDLKKLLRIYFVMQLS